MDWRARRASRSGNGAWGRHRAGAVLAAIVLLGSPGCALNRLATRHDAGVEDQPAPKDLGTTPTLGTDRSKIPNGESIPPAGLGVDLVRRSPLRHTGSSPGLPAPATI